MIARQAGGVSTACRSPAHLRCARTRRPQTDLAPRASRALGVPAPMPTRAELEAREAAALAPYAMRSRDSRGRRHPEPEHPLRMVFQRDRDRIIHSTAFRRLEYKTQVFVNHEGDYYRTRLTHTIEAAPVTRTLPCALRRNETLAAAFALTPGPRHTPCAPAAPSHVRHYQAVRRVIDRLVSDLCAALVARVRELRVETLVDVRRVKPRLVEYSPEMAERNQELKAFLYDRLYTHYRVTRMT